MALTRDPASGPAASASRRSGLLLSLLIVLVVALGAAGTILVVEWLLRSGRAAEPDGLEEAVRAQRAADGQRLAELALVAAELAADPEVEAALRTPILGQTAATAGARPPALTEWLASALDDSRGGALAGIVLGNPAGGVAASTGLDADLAAELVGSEVAARAQEEGRASGAWRAGDGLFLAAAVRVERDFEPLGVLAVVDRVGRARALAVRDLSRADVSYFVRDDEGAPSAIAGTLGREPLRAISAGSAGALMETLERGERSPDREIELAGGPARLALIPLLGPSGQPVAARATIASAGRSPALLRTVEAAALAAAGVALLLGLAGGTLLARRFRAPLVATAAAARAAAAGDLAAAGRYPVPPEVADLFADLAAEEALAALATRATVAGPAAAAAAAARDRSAILAVEMSRYARQRPDDDPREVVEHHSRDQERIRQAVVARRGRLESALGHRVLALFSGDGATARAVGAGAEILGALSQPENAFDEVTPPAVAIAAGALVRGGPAGARSTLGLPVQEAESLLREAAPGDFLLAKTAHRDLAPRLSEAGIDLPERRALLSPRPLHPLAGALAERVVSALGVAAQGSAGDVAALSPGSVLAERFVLVAPLGAGPAWALFAAHDRQSGARVVVKALDAGVVADVGALEELDSGARGVLHVSHPALARVVDLGVSEGLPYVAAQWVEGATLARVLGWDGGGDGSRAGEAEPEAPARPVPPAAGLRIARQLASGLAALHGAGLTHGAVRPAAIVLEPRGRAVLADLGTASLLLPPGIDPRADEILGSRRHLAPERRAGGEPTPAPPDPTELPDGLAEVLARCLAISPAERYPDGGALAEALAGIRSPFGAR